MTNTPIKWFGGKSYHKKNIIQLMRPYQHDIYVEVFGGSGAVLFAKPPVKSEIYNDLDKGLVNFFKVLSDPELFKQFRRKVAVLPYSRELYNQYQKTWNKQNNKVDKAVQWFFIARQSFAGRFGNSWGYSVTSSRNMNKVVSGWLSAIDRLPECHDRMQRVLIENNDFRKIIKAYDTPRTMFYLDPPYIPDTRKGGEYKHEMTADDHVELVDILLNIKGHAILSGYRHNIYNPLIDNNWDLFTKDTICHAVGKTKASRLQGKGNLSQQQQRTECFYCSPLSTNNKNTN